MAGFWSGFGKGFSEGLDREERRRQFEETMKQRRTEAILPQLIKRQTKVSETKGKLASLGNRLRGYGLEDAAIGRILETGDVESIEAFTKNLDNGYRAAEEAGRGNQFLETVKTTLDNATYQPAQEATLDLSGLEQMMGEIGDEFALEGMTTTVPGAFSYKPPVYTESRDVGEYGQLEERIAENAKQLAQNEKRKIDQQLSAITQRLESSALTEDEETALREDTKTLLERSQTVGTALDAFSGEEKDAFPLLSLYGTQSVNKMVSDFPTYDPSSLQPAFQENIGKAPFAVTSADQVKRLTASGILRENSSVLLDGEVKPVQEVLKSITIADSQSTPAVETDSDGIPSVSSKEQAQQLVNSGVVGKGDKIRINGKIETIRLED